MSLLDRLALFLVLFYAALRVHGTGLDTAEPETVLLSMVAVAACAFAAGGALLRERSLVLPPRVMGWGLAAFAVFAGMGVAAAGDGGYLQAAVDLGWNWLADGLVFLAALNVAAPAENRRALTAALGAGLVLTLVFGLYQRFYGMDYLRSVLSTDGAAAMERLGDAFGTRLASQRISGQFAYANALGGFVLMLLPLAAAPLPRWRELSRGGRFFSSAVLATGLLILVFSGSKAGFLVAKLGEFLVLLRLSVPAPSAPAGSRVAAAIRRGAALAGLAGAGTAFSLGVTLVTARAGGPLAGNLVLAALWLGEIVLLARWARLPELPVRPRKAGFFLTGLGLAGILAGGLYLGSDTAAARTGASLRARRMTALAERLETARAEVRKQLGVRGNYWAGALKMLRDRPGRGYGLDNFASYYGRYKTPEGWEVRRVHNLYLQLAVDGGLGLLTAFLLVWAGFFCALRRRPDAPAPASPRAAAAPETWGALWRVPAVRTGLWAGGAAFAVTYLFFLCGIFTGLGVEFFFSEFYRMDGAAFSPAAFFIHTVMNWLLLPAAWAGGFLCTYRLLRTTDPAPWLRLGALLALVHFFFDFHYYQAVNSGYFWLLAAAALACGGGVTRRTFSPKAADALAAGVIVAAAATVFLGLRPQFQANCSRTVLEKLALESRRENLDNMRELALDATRFRPGDATLWQTLAEVQIKRREPPAAEKAARKAVAANPASAGARVFLAQLLEAAPYPAAGRAEDIQKLYREALELYPGKPRYLLLYAEFLHRHARRDSGRTPGELARAARDLSARSTDDAARLNPAETRRAAALALEE